MRSFDPVWETNYSNNESLNLYPFDSLVSWIFKNAPRGKSRSDIKILETGCGAGNNLWFAAREGFAVSGIDASASAINFAKTRFSREGLSGDLRVGDVCELPFDSSSFDLVIDRACLTYLGNSLATKCFSEIHRVLKRGGLFFFNPYSDRHSAMAGARPDEEGKCKVCIQPELNLVSDVNFYSRKQLLGIFSEDLWKVKLLEHVESLQYLGAESQTHAEWRVTLEKI
jgi:SAM-dependent methyltransferase